MSTLEARYLATQERIRVACQNANRPLDSVTLLAVSKTKPAASVSACYALGQRAFGENYLQDGVEKIEGLQHLTGIQWHFIGPLQSNKTRPVAMYFDWLETLSREKIATRLNDQRPEEMAPLQVLIQVNISGEAQKAGVAPDSVLAFAESLQRLPRLQLRGLMCIPEALTGTLDTRDDTPLKRQFEQMKQLFDVLARAYPPVDTLSMGMSGDLELAIEAGATEIRIGTDIFGARNV